MEDSYLDGSGAKYLKYFKRFLQNRWICMLLPLIIIQNFYFNNIFIHIYAYIIYVAEFTSTYYNIHHNLL